MYAALMASVTAAAIGASHVGFGPGFAGLTPASFVSSVEFLGYFLPHADPGCYLLGARLSWVLPNVHTLCIMFVFYCLEMLPARGADAAATTCTTAPLLLIHRRC